MSTTYPRITRLETACRAPLAFGDACFRHASVLSTDVDASDPAGFVPVCKVHLREAITRGLERAAERPAGYRTPVMILPLDTRSRP